MKKTSILIATLLVVVATLSGCKKFVEVDPPKTEILTAQAFLKDNSATAAVLGIYTNMQNDLNLINSGTTINAGLSADELVTYYESPLELQFQQNRLLPTNSTIGAMWSAAYKNLAQINTCIAGIGESTSLSPSVKAQLIGESKFSRAFINFYLVNLWGSIPLVTTTNYKQNAVLPQSSQTEIYNSIITDCKDAQLQLTNTYPTTGKVRPNKWAATALLARAYLYIKDYANAEIQSSAVIASGTYGMPSLDNAFLKGSSEAIWQLLPVSNYSATQEGAAFLSDVSYGGAPRFYITDALLNSFEAGDNRKISWIKNVTDQNTLYHYPYKYKDVGQYNSTAVTENYIMLRLAEQYLIRAEARAYQNKLQEGLSDLNTIRNRAGLNSSVVADQQGLLLAIASENRHEFFAEWGHRWMDLKRTGKADAVLSALKPTWQPRAALFPIPQSEINLNRNLIQNP